MVVGALFWINGGGWGEVGMVALFYNAHLICRLNY